MPRTTGTAPATAASYSRLPPWASAASCSSGPASARSALFAVTTLAPRRSARRMRLLAGSTPPMSSTTMSAESTSVSRSSLSNSLGTTSSRGVCVDRTPIPANSIFAPARAARSASCRSSLRTTSVPTTPQPSTTQRSGALTSLIFSSSAWQFPRTRIRAISLPWCRVSGRESLPHVEAEQILNSFAANDLPRLGARDGDDPRAGNLVIVRCQGPPVRTRRCDDEQVSGAQVLRQVDIRDEDISRFAVLTHDSARHGVGRRGPVCEPRGVIRAVEDRTDVVAHPPVDGHVHAPALVQLDVFDRAHFVDRHHRGPHNRSARFDGHFRHVGSQPVALSPNRRGEFFGRDPRIQLLLPGQVGDPVSPAEVDFGNSDPLALKVCS